MQIAKMQRSVYLLILMGLMTCFAWELYEYHYVETKKPWSEARKYCREHHTDLATLSNMTDVKRLEYSAQNDVEAWIGLHIEENGNKTWHWSLPGVEYDNDKKKNKTWDDGEPNGGGNDENCGVVRKNNRWNDVQCTNKFSFICYNESETPEKFHLVEENKNWWEAQRYCREKHTDLISGLHQLQDDKVKGMISKLHQQQNNNGEGRNDKQVFIGLFRDTWKWSDGSSFSFRHWDPEDHLTSFQQNKNQCAMIQLNEQRRWKIADCGGKKTFFCYEDNVILIKEKMSWEDALYYCRDHHHDLVTISNLDEQRWVQEKAKSATTPFVWTGVRYTCTLDFWFWVSDEAVSYKNWASGEEMDECNMSGAMEKGGQHKWFKKNDAEEFHFLCSKS